jgi:type I restriction enzyme S subunit
MLGDYLTVQNGYAFNSKLFDADGEIGLIRIRDLREGVSTETRYTGEFDGKYIVRRGDLLIGMDGEFRCYEWKGEDALLNQRVCRLQDFDTELDKRFLLYAINDELKKIEDATGFTTVKHLSSKAIKEIQLHLPPIAEQKRIVAKLDAAFAEIDRAIEITNHSISAARDNLNNVIDAKTSEQDGWLSFKVSDLGLVQTGSTPKTADKGNYGIDVPFVKPPHFNSNGTISPSEEGLSIKGSQFSRKAAANSVMMVCIGATIGKVAVCSEDVCFNQQINALTPRKEFDAELIYWQMRGNRFQNAVLQKSGQATLPIISKSKWQDLLVYLPASLSEQVQIRNVLRRLSDNTDNFCQSKERKIDQLQSLKSAILAQELQPREAA